MAGEILYLRGKSAPRSDLVLSFDSRGYSVSIVRDFISLQKRCAEEEKPKMIVIDASADDDETTNRITELRGREVLFALTILFIGHKARGKTEKLRYQYENLYAFDVPFELSHIMGEMTEVLPEVAEKEEDSSTVDSSTVDSSTVDSSTVDSSTEELHTESFEQSDNQDGQDREVVGAPVEVSVDPKVEEHHKKAKGGEVSFGVRFVEYIATPEVPIRVTQRRVRDFLDAQIIPKNSVSSSLIGALAYLTAENETISIRARRTSAIASYVSEIFSLPETRRQAVRMSGLLFNMGEVRIGPAARGGSDLISITEHERRELVKHLQSSVEYANTDIGEMRVIRDLQALVAHFAGESATLDDEIREEAQCVLVAEIIARNCWKNDEWDSYGAYKVVRYLQQQDLDVTKGDAYRAIMRFIVRLRFAEEAEHLNPEKLTEVIAAAKREAEAFYSQRDVKKTQIWELMEGMVIARPLISIDGRLVVPAGMTIDNETLLKIWQLSLIRSLCLPLIIVR
ncbi:MAG: hypothetical protein PHC51_04665 [bacterium]|nr:hypothetical protein [bacterium]